MNHQSVTIKVTNHNVLFLSGLKNICAGVVLYVVPISIPNLGGSNNKGLINGGLKPLSTSAMSQSMQLCVFKPHFLHCVQFSTLIPGFLHPC